MASESASGTRSFGIAWCICRAQPEHEEWSENLHSKKPDARNRLEEARGGGQASVLKYSVKVRVAPGRRKKLLLPQMRASYYAHGQNMFDIPDIAILRWQSAEKHFLSIQLDERVPMYTFNRRQQ